MVIRRKPFAEFAAELAAGLLKGRGDQPIAEIARLQIVEAAPGDWRLSMLLDSTIEVISDERFASREEAVEATVDRLVECPGEIITVPIQ